MKKLLSILLAVAMSVSLFATTAFAGEYFGTANLKLTVKGANGTSQNVTIPQAEFGDTHAPLDVEGGTVEIYYDTDSYTITLYAYADEGYYLDGFTNEGEAAAIYESNRIYLENIGNPESMDHNQAIITMEFKEGHGYHEGDYALANSLIQRSKYKDSIIHREYITSWEADSNTLFYWTDETPRRLTDIYFFDAEVSGEADLSGATGLINVDLNSNDITSVKLPETDILESVDLSCTDITSISVSKLTGLLCLYVSDTAITSLDLTKNTELTSIDVYNTNLTSLDISKNTKLEYISISNTRIDELDVSHLPSLIELALYSTAVASLDVKNNPELTYLDIDNTAITSIDLTNNPKLETFYGSYNDITSLDLSHNPELQYLYLSGTPVKNLDLSNNPALFDVYLDYTDTDYIDLTEHTQLDVVCVTNKTKTNTFELTPAENGTLRVTCQDWAGHFWLEAYPDEGYLFDGWTGLPADLGEFAPTDESLDFEAPAETVYISGSFSADPDYVPDDGDGGPLDNEELPPIRIKGKTRYETSFQIAKMKMDFSGGFAHQNIIIASGKSFPDALSGSVFASMIDAPILMASGDNDAELIEYISSHMKYEGTVYILGGTAAVPESTEVALSEQFRVERIKGTDRYLTSIAIIQRTHAHDCPLIVVTGRNYADSLSASSLGLPILLVDGKANSLGTAQKEFLDGFNPSEIYIIGGTGAVSEGIEAELADYADVERIKGATRYDTSVAVAEHFFDNPRNAVFTYGENFPDGLCGGPLANTLRAPLILTRPGSTTAAKNYVAENDNLVNAFVLGGSSLIDDATLQDIMQTGDDVFVYGESNGGME